MLSYYFFALSRQFRSKTMRLFCFAIAIACAVTLTITLLIDRLEQQFDLQAKEMIAADLVLESTTELSEQQRQITAASPLRKAGTLTFQTMAYSQDSEKFLLSSIKAVSNGYPLLGELIVADELFGRTETIKQIPTPGEVWVEDRILHEFGLSLGESITVGELDFKVSRILVFEPDRGNSFYSFTPRILMNLDDISAAGVVRPGSRVKYRYLFSGASEELAQLRDQLAPSLALNQRFITVADARQALSSNIERAYRFLNITALIAILLGAIAVALVSYKYSNEMTHQYALYRCLGLAKSKMIGTVVMPIVLFSMLGILLGFAVGSAVHIVVLQGLGDLISTSLPRASYKPYLISALTIIVIVISFSWPFLNKLLHTPPKLLLNRDEAQKQPVLQTISFMFFGLLFLVYLSARDLQIGAYAVGVLLAFIVIAHFLSQLAMRVLRSKTFTNYSLIKLAAKSLKANHRIVSIQIIAISLTFFSLALITTIQDDLVTSWQSKIPDDAPNIFVINLFEEDKQTFLDALSENSIQHNPIYPIVRGRLSAVNQVAIRKYASKETQREDESLDRDLSLTWAAQLPENNTIVEGRWHSASDLNAVSVEQGIAENLEISVGDELSFTVGARALTARVNSIREVQWESFAPNFYMIFSPDALEELSATYMTSFYLAQKDRGILRELVTKFPNATIFDVDFLLNQIQTITQKISFAVEIILYFALVASLMIFFTIELILRDYKTYSMAILKVMGADTALIQRIFRIEFLIVGLVAGAIAYCINTIVSFAVSNYIIAGDFIFNPKTLILCMVIAPVMVLLAGYFSVRRIREIPIKKLLSAT